ncbi:excisionase family DNA-binding protein [uncultured Massilia sp.]|uniref:excisionase family DNA-binding protein n=1 Tax=uncultured Massilia sp. TaxID=169973 RepID=UPI0025F4737A|nr:excisionase family DNA-binding protein [uncultured Massilia sp.]
MLKDTADVCTTQEAATLLGISLTSVQKLVESGELAGWKTAGGHRRIQRAAVLAFRDRAPGTAGAAPSADVRTTLLVVEDDEVLRTLYAARLPRFGLPLDIQLCSNGYDGLIEVGLRPPDVLMLDIAMQGIDGYEIMETVLARPALRHMHIAIVTGMADRDLAARGGLPPGVARFGKPVPFDQLRGFLTACCMHKQRTAA